MMEKQEDDIIANTSEQNQENNAPMAGEESMSEAVPTEGEVESTTELRGGEYTPYNDALI